MQEEKKATIAQIAQAAGVSPSTVSRVLNGFEGVNEETQSRVQHYIAQFGYQPNVAAQSLAGKRTKTLAVFVPYGFSQAEDVFTVDSMTCYQQVNAVVTASARRGYKLVTTIITDPQDPEQLQMVRRTFYQGMVDGGLFIEFDDPSNIIDEIVQAGYVVGVLDQDPAGRGDRNRIIYNYANRIISSQAMGYLYGMGHRRIAVLGGPDSKFSGRERMEGLLSAFEDFQLEPHWVRQVDFAARPAYEALASILRDGGERPTAIVCGNDAIAFGAIEAIREAGLRVPEDISVIGVDDHVLSARVRPALTTFHIDITGLLSDLTGQVLDAIDQSPEQTIRREYRYTFRQRESCCPPRAV